MAAARKRLERFGGVRFVEGDMHALPFEAACFDAVLMMNNLTYAERPGVALAEAARVSRPGGVVTGVTLRKHAYQRVVDAYGHVNLGFTPQRLEGLLHEAGLQVDRCEVSSREPSPPHFEVITFRGRKESS
jgi:ArsR family transcriptional regulator